MKQHSSHQINRARRQFLRATGITLALPMLKSVPSYGQPSTHSMQPPTAGHDISGRANRLVAINVGLGLHLENIIPIDGGSNYETPLYLEPLDDLRSEYTVISGVSHPNVGGGHFSSKSFLTAARHPNSAGFRNSISIDQLAAERLGTATRFPSLALTSSGPGLSWSRAGVEVPAQSRPSRIFDMLFLDGTPQQREAQRQRLQNGQSVLDVVLDQTARMSQRVSLEDRQKLEQYYDAVREAELRLQRAEEWSIEPKPNVDRERPVDQTDGRYITECMELMYDLMFLAIQTDSTRFITYFLTGMNAVPFVDGVDIDYHNLSHHGKDPVKLEQLALVELELMNSFSRFTRRLAEATEDEARLLDRTMVLFGSNLGNANSHDAHNLPIVLAGGGFRHGNHLSFDRDNNYPLPNLYVSMLQQLGLEVDEFVSSTGTMRGLEAS